MVKILLVLLLLQSSFSVEADDGLRDIRFVNNAIGDHITIGLKNEDRKKIDNYFQEYKIEVTVIKGNLALYSGYMDLRVSTFGQSNFPEYDLYILVEGVHKGRTKNFVWDYINGKESFRGEEVRL